MIKLGDINKIFTKLIITALSPSDVPLPAEKKASMPANPAKNTPTIGMKIATIAKTNADIPNAFKIDFL